MSYLVRDGIPIAETAESLTSGTMVQVGRITGNDNRRTALTGMDEVRCVVSNSRGCEQHYKELAQPQAAIPIDDSGKLFQLAQG